MSPKRALVRTLVALALCTLSGCAFLRPRPPEYDEIRLGSGVVVQDLVIPETGVVVASGDRITIEYLLRLADGALVDSSLDRGQPIEFEVGGGEVPPGLEEGLLGMRTLGRRQIRVPSALGYGKQGLPPLIPPDADLWFEVELLSVEPAP